MYLGSDIRSKTKKSLVDLSFVILIFLCSINEWVLQHMGDYFGGRVFFAWRVVRSYWRHLEEIDPIWGDDLTHSPFIRRPSSCGFLGFSSAVRQMPGDLCTAARIILLSPLSLATDVTDATLGASGLWLRTRTGAGGTATLA